MDARNGIAGTSQAFVNNILKRISLLLEPANRLPADLQASDDLRRFITNRRDRKGLDRNRLDADDDVAV
jgi:hypothetical protein